MMTSQKAILSKTSARIDCRACIFRSKTFSKYIILEIELCPTIDQVSGHEMNFILKSVWNFEIPLSDLDYSDKYDKHEIIIIRSCYFSIA